MPRKSKNLRDGASQLRDAETVSGRWLVKALLATLAAAGFALYLTVCLLFYQGQWQFVFSPPSSTHSKEAAFDWLSGSWAKRTAQIHTSPPPPATAASVAVSTGLPIVDRRFDYTQEGVARLDGWWIPSRQDPNIETLSAAQAKNSSSRVVLFFSDGRSDLPENIAVFRALHALGVSVFAFDYRGIGASQPGHPSQMKAYADGRAAFRYLTTMRHIDATRIVFYGAAVGAAVAAHVAAQEPQIAGIVLENPQPSFVKQVRREQHIHLLPMWLIFRDRFDISRIVPSLEIPKLLIATPAKPEYSEGATEIYQNTPAPKRIVHINTTAVSVYTQAAWRQAMREFLNSLATQ